MSVFKKLLHPRRFPRISDNLTRGAHRGWPLSTYSMWNDRFYPFPAAGQEDLCGYAEMEGWELSNDTDHYGHSLFGSVREVNGKPDILFVDRRSLLCSRVDESTTELYRFNDDIQLDMLADLDYDGLDEVFVSYMDADDRMWIEAVNGEREVVRRWSAGGVSHRGYPAGSMRAVGLVDLDRDGRQELLAVVNSRPVNGPRGVYCFDAERGTLLWRYLCAPQVSNVIAADINGDNLPEILFGTVSTANGAKCADGSVGQFSYVYALDAYGALKWRTKTGQRYTGAYVSAVDVDLDGIKDVVVRLSGNPVRAPNIGKVIRLSHRGRTMDAYDAHSALTSLAVLGPERHADSRDIAVADLDGNVTLLFGPLTRKAKVSLAPANAGSRFGCELKVEAAADLDGVGGSELLVATSTVKFIDPAKRWQPDNLERTKSALLVLDRSLQQVKELPLVGSEGSEYFLRGAVCDVNDDGQLDWLALGEEIRFFSSCQADKPSQRSPRR